MRCLVITRHYGTGQTEIASQTLNYGVSSGSALNFRMATLRVHPLYCVVLVTADTTTHALLSSSWPFQYNRNAGCNI